jgi:hypothetical protein
VLPPQNLIAHAHDQFCQRVSVIEQRQQGVARDQRFACDAPVQLEVNAEF